MVVFFGHVELAHGDMSIIPAKYARRDAQEAVRYSSPAEEEKHLPISSQHGRVAGRSAGAITPRETRQSGARTGLGILDDSNLTLIDPLSLL